MPEQCPCNHCGGKIEFYLTDLEIDGKRLVDCPHCGRQTIVSKLPQNPPSPQVYPIYSPPPGYIERDKRSKQSGGILKTLILIVSIGMLAIGSLTTLDEMGSRDETVYQQIASRIGMVGGVSLFGFGLLTMAVCLVKNE